MYMALFDRTLMFIPHGFACTSEELPREIATYCRARGARGPVSFEYVSTEDTAIEIAKATGRRFVRGGRLT